MSTTVPMSLSLIKQIIRYIPDSDQDTINDVVGALSPKADMVGDPQSLARGGYRCGYVDMDGNTRLGFITAFDPASDTFTVITPGVPGHADISPDEMSVYLTAKPLWEDFDALEVE